MTSSCALLAGSLSASPSRAPARRANPPEVRIAVVGLNGQGRAHLRAYQSIPGVKIAALCDVDREVLEREAKSLDRVGIVARKFTDLRKLLELPEIDAVSLCLPNHWHALATIWACQAGKDVFVESPASHSIWEGRRMVEAAQKYDRIVQAALDARASPSRASAYRYACSGQIGEIQYVRAFDYERRTSLGKVVGPQKVPPHIDYDLWSGPAPLRPLLREFLHFDWHWQWDTGGGELTCNGATRLDEVRWALAKSAPPRRVFTFGGRYAYADDAQTPNTLVALYDFDSIPVLYEVRGLPESRRSENMDPFTETTASGRSVRHPHDSPYRNGGVAIFCEGGYCLGSAIYDNDGKRIKQFGPERPATLHENFIAAVRSRAAEDLSADIIEAHASATTCHMANISHLCGEPLSFDRARTAVAIDEQAERAFDRFARHLAENGVDTDRAPVVVGRELSFDSAHERFTGAGSTRANLFLKDAYREPFLVPEKV